MSSGIEIPSINSIDRGGSRVPCFASRNLHGIARENGLRVTEFGSCEVRYFSNRQPQLVISPSAAAKTKIAVILSQKTTISLERPRTS
jgi:hypothetical protein